MLTLAALLGCGSDARRAAPPSPTITTLPTVASPTPLTLATPGDPTARSIFENGVAYPKWGAQVYGARDASWPDAAQALRAETGAGWVEMIVSLDQNGYSGTTVYRGPETLTTDALYAGILSVREAGLQVFIEPLLNVHNETDNWSGKVTFATQAQAQAWFQSYWAAYEPYVMAAKEAGAAQVSIGTEYDKLQNQYPDLWMWLAHQVKLTFSGPVTYDLNHSTLGQPLPAWMRSPDLSALGVSMYFSLLSAPADLTAPQIERLWEAKALPLLDALSARSGKPVILSEVGYRNATDALYHPWTWKTSAPADPALQGAAYAAALAATASDPHIAGVYFWGWNTGQFSPAAPAIAAMRAAWA
jgi:hypothetical protein